MKTKSQKAESRKRFWDKFKEVNKAAFWTCLLISIALIVVAFFIPPQAVIDGSVIAAVGELFGFAALGVVIEGIEKGRSVSISKGSTTFTVNDENNEITE